MSPPSPRPSGLALADSPLKSNGSGNITLEGYMADAQTRVFNYNGRKLVSILGRESFPGERVFKLPTKAVEFASRQPITSALLPCRIGYYPNARGQKVSRPNGDWAFTLLFCLDGAGTLHLSNTTQTLTRATIALLRPFEFHAYEADAKHPWSYYWIHFNGQMAQQYYDALTEGGRNVSVAIDPDVRFVESFEKILAIYQNGEAYKTLVQASGALHQLLSDLYGRICGFGTSQESAEERVERTLEVMRNNLGMHVSIHELASIARMSHGYYALQFRRHTGESPRSYFNKLKIAKACDYLQTTTAKVESIAHMVGYEDAFYFCRLFKRVVGCTPTEFRRAPFPFPPVAKPRAASGKTARR